MQHSLLTLYNGEQFAMNPPTVEELRAKCCDFLTMMSVNPRNQTSLNQGSNYQKSSQITGATQPPASNAKDEAPPSNNNWTQVSEGNGINLYRDRGNRACFSCGEKGPYMRGCQAQRASLTKMGYVPPPDMVDPQELNAYYKKVLEMAPLKCFLCRQEGHMKPNCPLLRGAKPYGAGQAPPAADNRKEIEALKDELAVARIDASRNVTPQVAKTD